MGETESCVRQTIQWNFEKESSSWHNQIKALIKKRTKAIPTMTRWKKDGKAANKPPSDNKTISTYPNLN